MEVQEDLSQNFEPNYPNNVNPNQMNNFVPQIINTNQNFVPPPNVISNPNMGTIQNNIPPPNVDERPPFSPPKNDVNLMWYDISLISWFIMICSGWTLYFRFIFNQISSDYYPLPMESPLALGATMVICTIGFFVYFKNTTLSRDEEIWKGMLSKFGKLHSCAFLLVTSVFVILTGRNTETSYIFGFIYGILAVAGLIFVYMKTEFRAEWYVTLVLKKGTMSGLIGYMLYSTFFCFANCKQDSSFFKGTGIAFSIVVGICNLAFAVIYKDIFIALINFLLYFELSKTVFVLPTEQTAEGIIDIAFVVFSFGVIGYLLFKERNNLFK